MGSSEISSCLSHGSIYWTIKRRKKRESIKQIYSSKSIIMARWDNKSTRKLRNSRRIAIVHFWKWLSNFKSVICHTYRPFIIVDIKDIYLKRLIRIQCTMEFVRSTGVNLVIKLAIVFIHILIKAASQPCSKDNLIEW